MVTVHEDKIERAVPFEHDRENGRKRPADESNTVKVDALHVALRRLDAVRLALDGQ